MKFSDFIDVRDGTHESPKATDKGKKLITTKNLSTNHIDFSNAKNISVDDFNHINERSNVEKYDILLSMIGTVGNVYQEKNDNPDYAIKNLALLKFHGDELLSNWMNYYLQSEDGQNKIKQKLNGSTQQFISLKELRNLEIELPTKKEMETKSRPLIIIDGLIQKNNKINDNLLELLDTRFKQFISSSKLTDTTLHNIAFIHSGGNKPKEFSKVKTNEYSVPVYSNGVSKKGLFGFTNKAKVNERAVTVSARGTIGFTVLHNKPFVPIVRLIYLTYKSVPINFLYLLVRSLNIQGYGSTQQQITVPYLRKLKIKIPDVNEINKFDAENLSFFDLIWIKEKENILLFKIKENLLEKYF